MSTGTLHRYANNQLTAFEHSSRPSDKAVIFIGGLTNNLLGVEYTPALNSSIGPEWRLFEIMLSSSASGWGTGSLDRDTEEIAQLVRYLKGLGLKTVVLMGHSTGCQDSLHYLLNTNQTEGCEIDGIIFQAPVSDREAIAHYFEEVKKPEWDLDVLNKEAREIYNTKGPQELLPSKFREIMFDTPVSAYRWLSLSEKGGDDDYFSSDLDAVALRETFGRINKPLLILYSECDSSVPESVNKEELLTRWKSVVDEKLWSGIIVPFATHDIITDSKEPENALDTALSAVNHFLTSI